MNRNIRSYCLLALVALLGAGLILAGSTPRAEASYPTSLTGASASSSLQQAHTPQGQLHWQVAPVTLPEGRYGMGTVWNPVTGKFYSFGGANSSGTPQGDAWSFDPATNVVTPLSPMLTPVEGANWEFYNNLIYGFGGLGSDFQTTNAVQVYDPVDNTWGDGPPMPAGRWQMSASYYTYIGTTYIEFAGGSPTFAVNPQNTAWRYNLQTGAYSSLPNLPSGVMGAVGIRSGSMLYAGYTGGRNETLPGLIDTWVYDPTTDHWSIRAPLPTAENEPGASDRIEIGLNGIDSTTEYWVFGGGNPFNDSDNPLALFQPPTSRIPPGLSPNTSNVTQIYDTSADSWSAGPALNVARSFIGGASGGGYIVAIGGWTGSAASNVIEEVQVGSVATPTPTGSPAPSATATIAPTQTPGGPTATPEPCTIQFSDVPSENPFYTWIHCLACRGIISGYGDGTFRPGNNLTRGQLSKIVSNAAGLSGDPTGQTFEDVPSSDPFYLWIERLAAQGAIGGYTCGGAGEPCNPPGNRPYFRVGANVTRGQASKIVAIAAGLPPPPPSQQTFEDVAVGSAFWSWIESLASTGAISGYGCGGDGEPCVPPGNRPYFRVGANVTRGQASKIIANTFFPNCVTPSR